jgi:hypothetical protein
MTEIRYSFGVLSEKQDTSGSSLVTALRKLVQCPAVGEHLVFFPHMELAGDRCLTHPFRPDMTTVHRVTRVFHFPDSLIPTRIQLDPVPEVWGLAMFNGMDPNG